MTAPRIHAQTERWEPAAAMTRGRVMKGPTPIISSMLKRTAERRPMRRSRCAGVLEAVERSFGRLMPSPDCTLTMTMFFTRRVVRTAVSLAAVAGLFLSSSRMYVGAQEGAGAPAQRHDLPPREPSTVALPLPEDRGAAALEQALRRLRTTASAMDIVAHPDDEDGALLTYLSRGLGVRTILYTLTRGEGGQNAMSAETYDALGVIRTQELLKADEYYGARQVWGTEADFGFSKTQQEAFARWGHDRVLYDAVLAVRRERPEVIFATFIGAVSDGHGQHQVSGEIAQEVFKAAGDPKVFPDQLKNGIEPWQPLAVYGMVPFAPINKGQVFDYATGKLAPAKFKNYVTGEWIEGQPSTDATIPVGNWDPALGRSYAQIARQGWGEQKSQNGGANPTLSGPATARYHLWAAAPAVVRHDMAAAPDAKKSGSDLFHNQRVGLDTSFAGLASLAPKSEWLARDLKQIDTGLDEFSRQCPCKAELETAHRLSPIYRQTIELRAKVAASDLDAQAKASVLFEVDAKMAEFESAFEHMLGLELVAFRTNESKIQEADSAATRQRNSHAASLPAKNSKSACMCRACRPKCISPRSGLKAHPRNHGSRERH